MMIDFDYLWPKYGIRPDGVLHLGASYGQEKNMYVKHQVKNVIWVEAIPAVFEQLVKNVAIAGHTCINACVGDVDGMMVQFNISNNECQSSSILPLKHHKVIHPEVNYVGSLNMEMKRLDKILLDFKLEGDWFLNADLQGAELKAFMGMGDRLNSFKWVYSEVNKQETYEGCALVDEIDAYLAKFGFVRVETGAWVGDTWTDALYVKA